MMQQERRDATDRHFAPTGQPRRSADVCSPEARPERDAQNPIEHARLRRLTPELSGHINREAIDWSA